MFFKVIVFENSVRHYLLSYEQAIQIKILAHSICILQTSIKIMQFHSISSESMNCMNKREWEQKKESNLTRYTKELARR